MDSPFQGFKAVERVVERMTPLAQWLAANKPTTRTLALSTTDFERLKRYPDAAGMLNIFENEDGSLRWNGFTLRANYSTPPQNKGSNNHGRQSNI
jgi:hypothetical protein